MQTLYQKNLKPPRKLLALDGGGIRGIMTAIWLNKLEEKLGSPIKNHFDLISGTSTGAILACAIANGIPVTKILSIYTNRAENVFPPFRKRIFSRIKRFFADGISTAKYDGKGLEQELIAEFGNKEFLQLDIPTIIPCYDISSNKAVFFKSYRIPPKNEEQKPENINYNHMKIWEVCRASAAAPSYFPPYKAKNHNNMEVALIDGGVVANNPSACVIAEAIRVYEDFAGSSQTCINDLLLASFGTGTLIKSIPFDKAVSWGILQWALPIVDILLTGPTEAMNYISKQIISNNNYFRIQCNLRMEMDTSIDNSSPENIKELINIAENYINEGKGKEELEKLCIKLKQCKENTVNNTNTINKKP